METQNFTTTFLVDQTPGEAFSAIVNVRAWWAGLYNEKFEGETNKLNDEFSFRAGDGVHYSKQKLIELVPNEKVAWLVTDSRLTFAKDQQEWNGTKISFEISRQGDKTQVRFTHVGLVPGFECYGGCSGAWSNYINNNLRNLIATGKGTPAKTKN